MFKFKLKKIYGVKDCFHEKTDHNESNINGNMCNLYTRSDKRL